MKILRTGVLVLSEHGVAFVGWLTQTESAAERAMLPAELQRLAQEVCVRHAVQAAGFRLLQGSEQAEPQAVDWAAERAAADALQRFRVMPQRHQQCGHLRLDVLGPGRPGAWARLKAWAAGLIGARRWLWCRLSGSP